MGDALPVFRCPGVAVMLDENWFSEAAQGFAMSLRLQRKLHEERSPHQLISVYETESFGRLLALDGLTMLTERDHFIYHEMLTHPAHFTHREPRDVLIVGGGDCGTLSEVLRHPVRSVVQVELDERVTRVSERYFPGLCGGLGDARVRLVFQDAVDWIARAPSDTYDVLLLDTTDPVGQAARLFSAPFYRECRRVLRPDGVLAAQTESPFLDLELLRGALTAMGEAGFPVRRLLHFPQCSYPSGWWSVTLAGAAGLAEGFRAEEAAAKAFPTRYYNARVHESSQVLPEFLLHQLKEAP